jgi:hypothetical protein
MLFFTQGRTPEKVISSFSNTLKINPKLGLPIPYRRCESQGAMTMRKT